MLLDLYKTYHELAYATITLPLAFSEEIAKCYNCNGLSDTYGSINELLQEKNKIVSTSKSEVQLFAKTFNPGPEFCSLAIRCMLDFSGIFYR